jgi:hypothetical protein
MEQGFAVGYTRRLRRCLLRSRSTAPTSAQSLTAASAGRTPTSRRVRPSGITEVLRSPSWSTPSLPTSSRIAPSRSGSSALCTCPFPRCHCDSEQPAPVRATALGLRVRERAQWQPAPHKFFGAFGHERFPEEEAVAGAAESMPVEERLRAGRSPSQLIEDPVDDAAVAVAAFRKEIPDVTGANAVTADRPLSVLGAALLWSRWSTDLDLVRTPCIVIRAAPPRAVEAESPT